MRAAIVCSMFVLLAGCMPGKRPSEEQCREACLHRSKLYLEDKWAGELASAPPSEHARLEREHAAEWEDVKNNPNRGREACVVACNRPNRQGQVDCILKAKTLDEANACEQ